MSCALHPTCMSLTNTLSLSLLFVVLSLSLSLSVSEIFCMHHTLFLNAKTQHSKVCWHAASIILLSRGCPANPDQELAISTTCAGQPCHQGCGHVVRPMHLQHSCFKEGSQALTQQIASSSHDSHQYLISVTELAAVTVTLYPSMCCVLTANVAASQPP